MTQHFEIHKNNLTSNEILNNNFINGMTFDHEKQPFGATNPYKVIMSSNNQNYESSSNSTNDNLYFNDTYFQSQQQQEEINDNNNNNNNDNTNNKYNQQSCTGATFFNKNFTQIPCNYQMYNNFYQYNENEQEILHNTEYIKKRPKRECATVRDKKDQLASTIKRPTYTKLVESPHHINPYVHNSKLLVYFLLKNNAGASSAAYIPQTSESVLNIQNAMMPYYMYNKKPLFTQTVTSLEMKPLEQTFSSRSSSSSSKTAAGNYLSFACHDTIMNGLKPSGASTAAQQLQVDKDKAHYSRMRRAGRPKVNRIGCRCAICVSNSTPQWRFMNIFNDDWMDLVCNACYMKFNGSRITRKQNNSFTCLNMSVIKKPLRPSLLEFRKKGASAFPHLMYKSNKYNNNQQTALVTTSDTDTRCTSTETNEIMVDPSKQQRQQQQQQKQQENEEHHQEMNEQKESTKQPLQEQILIKNPELMPNQQPPPAAIKLYQLFSQTSEALQKGVVNQPRKAAAAEVIEEILSHHEIYK